MHTLYMYLHMHAYINVCLPTHVVILQLLHEKFINSSGFAVYIFFFFSQIMRNNLRNYIFE